VVFPRLAAASSKSRLELVDKLFKLIAITRLSCSSQPYVSGRRLPRHPLNNSAREKIMRIRYLTSLLAIFTAISAMAAETTALKAPLATAVFAGGCFWCMEPPFDALPGVVKTVSGYAGGKMANPSYEQVSAGGTGYSESIQITFDPAKVSYEKLLEVYWHNIDPTDGEGQFCDKGEQYRSIIFYQNEEQKRLAEQSKGFWQQNKPFDGEIKTDIVAETTFYPAEDYHQDYYLKNPLRYKFYRYRCGRDQRLHDLWGESAGH